MSGEIGTTENMEECLNCLRMIPSHKIDTHTSYCRRNIKKCQQCLNFYDINQWEDHEQEFHRKFRCQYCCLELPEPEKSAHLLSCLLKPKRCEYCDLEVPITTFQEHFRACESRTNQCERCSRPIPNKEFYQHLAVCEGIVLEDSPPVNVHRQNSRANFYSTTFSKFQSFEEFGTGSKKVKKDYSEKQMTIAKSLIEKPFTKRTKNSTAKYVTIPEKDKQMPKKKVIIEIDNQDSNVINMEQTEMKRQEKQKPNIYKEREKKNDKEIFQAQKEKQHKIHTEKQKEMIKGAGKDEIKEEEILPKQRQENQIIIDENSQQIPLSKGIGNDKPTKIQPTILKQK